MANGLNKEFLIPVSESNFAEFSVKFIGPGFLIRMSVMGIVTV